MPSKFKQELERLAVEKAPGPSPTFTKFHLIAALEYMAEKPIGRNKLAENLEVGEGAVRSIIGRLKDAGLIDITGAGCSLTRAGMKLWQEYRRIVRKAVLEKNELALGESNLAVLVNGGGENVRSGIEQRDAAIMMGARSVTTMVFRNRRLIIPSVSDNVAADFPIVAEQLVRLMVPEENDAIVVASADTSKKAEYSALAAAWTLLDG
jgi:DNA-binding Lrp family transcriptional regulator